MQINRNNYEEFFILYLDNELTAEGRAEVEAFVLVHPDLGEELELLLQTRFEPDQQLQFTQKESLLKPESHPVSPDINNGEEWMLLQVDGELSANRQQELAAWLAQNPERQKEMEWLERTRVEPDTSIVFPDKEMLYRRAAPARILPFKWHRVAIAASLLLAISTTALLLNKPGSQDTTNPLENIAQQPPPATNRTQENRSEEMNRMAKEENTQLGPKADDLPATDIAGNKTKTSQPQQTAHPNEELKAGNLVKKESYQNLNNLPSSSQNPNMMLADNNNSVKRNETSVADAEYARVEVPVNTPLTNSKQINYTPTVTSGALEPLEPVYALQDDASADEPGRKNKLRGFLRKVTRTFEKTTNLKATDPDDRLLIGGLAIQL